MEFRLHGDSCVLFWDWHDAVSFFATIPLYLHVLVIHTRYNTAVAYFDSSGNRFTAERPGFSLHTAAVLFHSISDVILPSIV